MSSQSSTEPEPESTNEEVMPQLVNFYHKDQLLNGVIFLS